VGRWIEDPPAVGCRRGGGHEVSTHSNVLVINTLNEQWIQCPCKHWWLLLLKSVYGIHWHKAKMKRSKGIRKYKKKQKLRDFGKRRIGVLACQCGGYYWVFHWLVFGTIREQQRRSLCGSSTKRTPCLFILCDSMLPDIAHTFEFKQTTHIVRMRPSSVVRPPHALQEPFFES
jgi:hypothetical protein